MFSNLKNKFKTVADSAKLVKECYSLLGKIEQDPSSPQAKEAGHKFLWMLKELYSQYKKEGFKSLTGDEFLVHLLSYPNNESAFKEKAEQDKLLQERDGQMQVNTNPQSASGHFQPLISFGKDLLKQMEKNFLSREKESQ